MKISASIVLCIVALKGVLCQTKNFLVSDGDNFISGGERVVSTVEATTSFVLYTNGDIAVEISGKSYGSRKILSDSITTGATLRLGQDGRLVEEDMDANEIWANTDVIGRNGPYMLSVEGDRRARIRDSNDDEVWSFPDIRANQTSLRSGAMDFLRSGEKVISPNGKYYIGVNGKGEIIRSFNKPLNSVASAIISEPSILILDANGNIFLRDHYGNIRWKSGAGAVPGSEYKPHTLEITDDGLAHIINGIGDTLWNVTVASPPPSPSPTTTTRTTTTTTTTTTRTTTTTKPSPSPSPSPIVYNCAGSYGACPQGLCCSQWGFCGTTAEYCEGPCQSQFGKCVEKPKMIKSNGQNSMARGRGLWSDDETVKIDINSSGQIIRTKGTKTSYYKTPSLANAPNSVKLTIGEDGNLWFYNGDQSYGEINVKGSSTGTGPYSVRVGSDGRIYFYDSKLTIYATLFAAV